MKKIPMGNYIKVAILFIITIILAFVLAENYKQKMKYEKSNNNNMSFLSTIKYEELDNYLVENHNGFIYIASSVDDSLGSFEESFKEYILDKELEHNFIYLDSSDYSSKIYAEIAEKYFSPKLRREQSYLGYQPNVLYIENGFISDSLYKNESKITLQNVIDFVNKYEVQQWFM